MANDPDDRAATLKDLAGARPPEEPKTVREVIPVRHSPEDALALVDPKTYVLIAEVARGGLGRILRARDSRLRRDVAVKMMRGTGRLQLARFVREAFVTARLQHPSIVPIYEAGRFGPGKPFYAMRFVEGRALHHVVRKKKTLAERLPLVPHVLAVADAIAYAHSNGFIHRDVKPENVIVGAFGETVVVDWGLAKYIGREKLEAQIYDDEAVESPAPFETSLTRQGSIVGTPNYMPPEQARGEKVDERVDVYAVGALLYFLLAGEFPYHGISNPIEVLRRVAARTPPTPVEKIEPNAPPELVAIVRKAMASRAVDRYASAKELADDLRRFQAGRLVSAHSYNTRQLFVRWLHQNVLVLSIGATAVLVALLLGGVTLARVFVERDRVLLARRWAESEQRRATSAEEEATQRADELRLLQAHRELGRDPTASIAWLKRLSPRWTGWADVRVVALEAKLDGIATVFAGHGADVTSVDISPDATRLATGSADRSVRIWDLATRGVKILVGHEAEVIAVAWSPDGKSLASTSRDHTVRIWDAQRTTPVRVLSGNAKTVSALAFVPDGRTLVGVAEDGTTRVWDVASGSSLAYGDHASAAQALALTADGTVAATGGDDGRIYLRDLRAGTSRLLSREPGAVSALSFSPDARTLAVTRDDATVRLVDLQNGAVRRLDGHQARAVAVRYSPDGTRLASGGADRAVRLWDLRAGTSRAFRGHGPVTAVSFAPDGRRLASASADRTARVWDVDTGERILVAGGPESATAFAVPRAPIMLLGGLQGRLSVVDVDTLAQRGFTLRGGAILGFAATADGRAVAVATADDSVRLFDIATSAPRGPRIVTVGLTAVATDRDGIRVLTAASDGVVRVFDRRGTQVRAIEGHAGPVNGLAVSPVADLVATAGRDKTVRLVDLVNGVSRVLKGHDDWVNRVAFSPDGSRVASASQDQTVRLWDVRSGESRVLRGHTGWVTSVAFSPDGARLVSSGHDQTVRVWDVAKAELASVRGLGAKGLDAVFVGSSARIAAAGADGVVRLWTDDLPSSGDALRSWAATATNALVGDNGVLTTP